MKTKLLIFTIVICGIANAQITPPNNIIGVDVSTYPQNPSFNYDSCFALGADLGMGSLGLFQNWTSVETAPNIFNMTIFDIANYYYPLHSMPIDLTIVPIHTNNLEVPSDLTTTTFDNPILINRFKTLLDSIKVHIPNVVLTSLVIGSEHDVYMGTNATMWAQYTTFYDSVSTYARTLWPGLKVATELTFSGITTYSIFAQTLNTNSDYIGVSYYPLNNDFTVKPVSTIPTDFSTLVSLYPSKQIIFYQYGYPSSISCNSSESQQAQFITQTFTTWDTYASNVKKIDFTWLHDLDTAAVNFYGTYYGLTDTIFLEYLHTLGLRTWNENGTDKAAFTELQCQAKQRGYNNLNINCTTGFNEFSTLQNDFTLFPNPFSAQTILQTDVLLNNATITIYNCFGQTVKEIKNIYGQTVVLSRDNLPSGLYFIRLTEDDKIIASDKLVITD